MPRSSVHRVQPPATPSNVAAELLLFFFKEAYPGLTRDLIEQTAADEMGVTIDKARSWFRRNKAFRLPSEEERLQLYIILKRRLEHRPGGTLIPCADSSFLKRVFGADAWSAILEQIRQDQQHLSELKNASSNVSTSTSYNLDFSHDIERLEWQLFRSRCLYVELLLHKWSEAATKTLVFDPYRDNVQALTWPAMVHRILILEPHLEGGYSPSTACVAIDTGGCGGLLLINFRRVVSAQRLSNEPFFIVRYGDRVCLGRQKSYRPTFGDKREIFISAGENVWATPAPSICQWDPSRLLDEKRFTPISVKLADVSLLYVSCAS